MDVDAQEERRCGKAMKIDANKMMVRKKEMTSTRRRCDGRKGRSFVNVGKVETGRRRMMSMRRGTRGLEGKAGFTVV